MKKWFTSKTLIFNTLTIIALLGDYLQGDFVASHPEYASLIGAVVAGVNWGLRLITNKGLEK